MRSSRSSKGQPRLAAESGPDAALAGAHEAHQDDGPLPRDRRRLLLVGRPTGSSAHVGAIRGTDSDRPASLSLSLVLVLFSAS